jgi:hypothetical protein
MKLKSLFSVALLLASFTVALAQPTARGNFLVGTRLGFSSARSTIDVEGSSNTGKSTASGTSINVAPHIGYFVTDNFVFGIGMEYLHNTTQEPIDAAEPGLEDGEQTDTDVLFGPYARFYLPWGDKALFLGLQAGFGHTSDQIGGEGKIRNNIVTVGPALGLTVFADNGFALETQLRYNWGKSQNTNTLSGADVKTTTFTNAIDLGIGLSYYFSR